MIVAMCGLPGTGKSTLATLLAARLGGVVLSKDLVRSSLFPSHALDYSTAQDDLTMRAVYEAAVYIRRARPDCPVFLDGRTYTRAYQVADLVALGDRLGEVPLVIECVCADEVARHRLEQDLASGVHPARNRTVELYLLAKSRAVPISLPRLVLDTEVTPLDECVARALAYLQTK